MSDLVKTEFGYVEADALAGLQDDFDTMQLLNSAEKVERLREELDQLHKELMGLHSMASRVIRGNTHIPMNGTGDDIHQHGPVAELCRSFNRILCTKGVYLWGRNKQQNSNKKLCVLH